MTTNDILIRPILPKDARDQYEMATHPAIARDTLNLPSMELAETQAWLSKQTPGRARLVAEVEGKSVGFISLQHFQRPRMTHAGSVGMFVHPDYWGQGIGHRLMTAALDVADNWLDLKRLELEVFVDNEAAIHLYKKFGFETEGVRRKVAFGEGEWRDDMVMARLRGMEGREVRGEGREAGKRPLSKRTPVQAHIRPPVEEDIEQLYELFRHPLVARTTLQMPTQEISLTESRMKTQTPGLHRYVAVVEDKIVGQIALHQANRPRLAHSASLGMMVSPDYWGRGIGTQLMDAILDLADNWLNLKRVELEVHTDNPAGIRLYEKSGFVIEGTKRFQAYGDGRWTDSYFMARIRD
ncbi:MAG: GNAT family N-acetyltransferase [Ardenticatenaceae bacterium]|nr:GNAT family N-acetyltransferase [Ardenticatenaceae bacterium]